MILEPNTQLLAADPSHALTAAQRLARLGFPTTDAPQLASAIDTVATTPGLASAMKRGGVTVADLAASPGALDLVAARARRRAR